VAFPPPSQAPILRPILQRTAEMASVMGDTWFGTPGGTGWASLRPPVTHETPGDPLARGLPSPVYTGRAGRQSHPQQMVVDRGKRPAEVPSIRMLQLSILHGLSLTFLALTSVICCPSAAQATP